MKRQRLLEAAARVKCCLRRRKRRNRLRTLPCCRSGRVRTAAAASLIRPVCGLPQRA